MVNTVRVARPGDVCVLLEPAEDEIPKLLRRQMALQARFGGRPHQRVHLTCQRFELRDERLLPDLNRRLRAKLTALHPFPISAVSLIRRYAPFWDSHLLRWRIRITDDLRRFGVIVDGCLTKTGIAPHFPYGSGWKPTHVTALEDVPELDLNRHLDDMDFPHHLFVARQVVLSRIVGRGEFELLEQIQLSGQ